LSKVWNGGDGWNPSGDVVCHALICYGPSHRSRQPRTTGSSTCPVWNDVVRHDVGSVPCLDEWEIGVVNRLGSHGERGVVVLPLA
jgi:hypothetical protein